MLGAVHRVDQIPVMPPQGHTAEFFYHEHGRRSRTPVNGRWEAKRTITRSTSHSLMLPLMLHFARLRVVPLLATGQRRVSLCLISVGSTTAAILKPLRG